MGILPTNRTTGDTAATHVADHNVIHALNAGGGWEKFRARGATLNRRYCAGVLVGGNTTTSAVALDTLLFMPFADGVASTVDRLAFHVFTAGGAGSVARVGLWSSKTDGTFQPDVLLVDGGGVDTTGTGLKEATVSVSFAADTLYWMSYLAGVASPTIVALANTVSWGLLGWASTTLSGPNCNHYSAAFSYAALPANTSSLTLVAANATLPAVAVRLT